MTVVGAIPAAGYANRLRGISGSKEVLSVGGRPVIDYVVDRMHAADAAELRVVTRPEKRDVIARAHALGATVIEAHPESLAASLLIAMRDLRARDIVLVGLPDSIWEPADGFVSLTDAVIGGADLALGLFRFEEPERAEVVAFDDDGLVTGVVVRPRAPASNWIWGCAAGRASAFRKLEGATSVGEFVDAFCREARVAAVPLSDSYVDIGTNESLAAVRERLGA